MKKYYQLLINLCLILILFLPFLTLAADNDLIKNLGVTAEQAGLTGQTDLKLVIGEIIKVILGFLAIIFLGLVLYGGFLWMTAAGDPGKIEKARNLIRNAIIGVIIILAAYAITWTVVNEIQKATTGNQAI